MSKSYQDRNQQDSLTAQAVFCSKLRAIPLSNSIGTPVGINGQTGQLIVSVDDGTRRTTNLGANVLGITGSIANGINGNGGYSFGRV
jgi:hypothetical protein